MAEPKQTKENKAVDLDAMTVEERVNYHYQHGQGSIQDIARVYRLDVNEVLHIIGEDELSTVQLQSGDLIDASEAGPGAQMNYEGKRFYVPYETN
jgi:hypothetical protein